MFCVQLLLYAGDTDLGTMVGLSDTMHLIPMPSGECAFVMLFILANVYAVTFKMRITDVLMKSGLVNFLFLTTSCLLRRGGCGGERTHFCFTSFLTHGSVCRKSRFWHLKTRTTTNLWSSLLSTHSRSSFRQLQIGQFWALCVGSDDSDSVALPGWEQNFFHVGRAAFRRERWSIYHHLPTFLPPHWKTIEYRDQIQVGGDQTRNKSHFVKLISVLKSIHYDFSAF